MTPEQSAVYTRMVNVWGCPSREARMIATADYRATEALGYAKSFVEDLVRPGEASIMVLAGPTGVGKTVAACWAAHHARPLDPVTGKLVIGGVRFRHVNDIAEQSLYLGDSDDKKHKMDVRNAACLVLDDVGAELRTDAFLAMIDALINYRYGSAGVTCITTNLPVDDFRARYGARVVDRIRGRGVWYDISHESLRKSQ